MTNYNIYLQFTKLVFYQHIMSLINSPDLAEKLASEVSLEKLTNFITYAKSVDYLWLWDYSKDVLVVMEAIKLLTNSLVYAFRVVDGYSERMWWNSEWVYLFRRIWEKSSVNIFSWENISWWNESVPDDNDAINFLLTNEIKKIITWPIVTKFLWVENRYVDGDWDELQVWILSESTIENIRNYGIEVIVLDNLV